MSDTKDLKGDLTKAFTDAVDDHAVKIGITGGVLSTLGFQFLGAAFMIASGVGLVRRKEEGKPIWCDVPPKP